MINYWWTIIVIIKKNSFRCNYLSTKKKMKSLSKFRVEVRTGNRFQSNLRLQSLSSSWPLSLTVIGKQEMRASFCLIYIKIANCWLKKPNGCLNFLLLTCAYLAKPVSISLMKKKLQTCQTWAKMFLFWKKEAIKSCNQLKSNLFKTFSAHSLAT